MKKKEKKNNIQTQKYFIKYKLSSFYLIFLFFFHVHNLNSEFTEESIIVFKEKKKTKKKEA